MRWPNGLPCELVEMYLLDIAPLLTLRAYGGSLRHKAVCLSHFVRFCFERHINFWDLSDGDFHAFVDVLLHEPKRDRPGCKGRNRNTVRSIIDECLAFLRWLQNQLFVGRTIVGPKECGPQIRLIERRVTSASRRHNAIVLRYPYVPPPDPQDHKRPISTELRDRIWQAFLAKADPLTASLRYVNRFKDEKEFRAELDYLRARRELVLLLLEATGARPGEIIRVRVSENAQCARSNTIVLPTLKRRRGIDPVRRIPVSPQIAIKIQLFAAKQRASILERLISKGTAPAPDDRLLLTTQGKPMNEATLTKDFQRICRAANVDQQVCPSMFRHRFVTLMVARHLRDFLDKHPQKSAAFVTDSDYRTILRKVATFTGHASELSLFRYIDWAWEEIGLFKEKNKPIVNDPDNNINVMLSLMAELRLQSDLSREDVINRALAKLTELNGKGRGQ